MSVNVKSKTPPSVAPVLKNAAAAPFIYFDTVPCFGFYAGNLELELGARVLMPKADGQTVATDLVSVAHVRCNVGAAVALIDALQRGLEMMKRQQATQTVEAPKTPLDS